MICLFIAVTSTFIFIDFYFPISFPFILMLFL